VKTIATTCPYCGVGCGVLASVAGDGSVSVKGDPDHPANFGRLCSKGSALADTLDLDGRLLYPEVNGKRVSWDDALDAVAEGFQRVIERYGPDAVAFYVSGQLLTEDYYVANKLMKGFIGSANIDTNSRLCMASSVAGHKRAFGSDTVPGCYEDLELADLIVLVGSNTAWCHPVIYQRIAAAKEKRPAMKLIVIDPRRTATCEIADLHLPIAPGTDVALFNGLLNHLRREDRLDLAFIEKHTEGAADAFAAAREGSGSIPAVAQACQIPEAAVASFYQWFTRTERVVTVYSQGVNQSSSGTDKVNSIINCHLASGRIGKPGMGPFSVTGQPNAMGGREVGGLANQLAAHMDFDAISMDLVRRFWGSPRIASKPGLKAVDLFQAVERGEIKALWIMATNPAVSMPEAERVRAALARCDFVVVSDCIRHTDTTASADVLLPASAWGEKEGTVTNSERRISRQRRFLDTPGQANPDWWALTQVARRMGFGTDFPYECAADVFREYAALSGFENHGSRDFDISRYASISATDYEQFQPVQWPVTIDRTDGTPRMFTDQRFYTPSRRARFVTVRPRPPANTTSPEYPLVLNTGRVRDHWHTMTRTAKAARLSTHVAEPYVEIHPRDAERYGITTQSLVRVDSAFGEIIVRALISENQQPGSVFVPMHWNAQFASLARVDALVNPAADPVSGQPELKHTPVRVAAYQPQWHGFLLTRRPFQPTEASYWVSVKETGCWRYELAGNTAPADWGTWVRDRFGESGEWLEYNDRSAGRYRAALIREGKPVAAVFFGPSPSLPPREWLAGLFARAELTNADRMNLLAGRPLRGGDDPGRTVCACFSVGLNTLRASIRNDKLTSVEAIGSRCRAGTNCGSCIPELKNLLAEASGTPAREAS